MSYQDGTAHPGGQCLRQRNRAKRKPPHEVKARCIASGATTSRQGHARDEAGKTASNSMVAGLDGEKSATSIRRRTPRH